VAGGLLSTVECLVDLVVPAKDVPTPTITIECNKNLTQDQGDTRTATWVTITQPSGAVKFNKVEFYRSIDGVVNANMAPFNNGLNNTTGNFASVPSYFQALPNSKITAGMTVIARVYFTNGCSKDYALAKCPIKLIAEAQPDIYAKASCPLGGANPDIVVTEVIGFTSLAQYSIDGVNYQTSKTFTNKPAGIYTVYVRETIEGIEYTATTTVTILEPIEPEVYLESTSICVGGSTKLVILANSGTVFAINTPTSTVSNAVTVNGRYELSIPYSTNAAGNYQVTLTSTNVEYCPSFSETLTLEVGGQSLMPTIEIEAGTYCVGSPIKFRILNGNGATFTVTSNGTGVITSTVQSGSEYNGTYTPNNTNGQIQIIGLIGSDTCNTTTTPTLFVTSIASPIITSTTAICQPDNTVTVVVNTTGATSVKIQNVNATESPSGVWTRVGITGLTSANIIAQNSSCQSISTVEIPDCSCPAGEPIIFANDNLCGPGNAVFTYDYFIGQTPDGSWTYRWQSLVAGNWVDMTIDDTYIPLINPIFTFGLAQNQSVTVRIVFTNSTNNCQYNSDAHTVSANTSVNPPNLTVTPSSPVVGYQVNLTASTGFTTYQWKINGVNVGTNNFFHNFIPTTTGSYTVQVDVINANGCTSTKTTNFIVGVNCPDIPITYLPSGPCQNIRVQVTNTVGVQISYTATGTGSLGTPINETGIMDGTNIIEIDSSVLDPNESVTSLDFTFTYQVGANPECEISKTLNFSYTRCPYGDLRPISGNHTYITCLANAYRFNAQVEFEIPCIPIEPQNTVFGFLFKFDGNSLGTYGGLIGQNPSCGTTTVGLSSFPNGLIPIDLGTYGGQTGDLTVEVFFGLTSLGTVILEGDLVLPASC